MLRIRLAICSVNSSCLVTNCYKHPQVLGSYCMPLSKNQMISHFYVFISLLIAIYLVVIHVLVSQQEYIHVIALACWVLSSYTARLCPTPMQNGEFRGHCLKSLLGSLGPLSVHSTIIIINTLIKQAGSYFVITNLPYMG